MLHCQVDFEDPVMKQSRNCLSFVALLSRMENQVSYAINTDHELVIDVSLVLSVSISQKGQNHLF